MGHIHGDGVKRYAKRNTLTQSPRAISHPFPLLLLCCNGYFYIIMLLYYGRVNGSYSQRWYQRYAKHIH